MAKGVVKRIKNVEAGTVNFIVLDTGEELLTELSKMPKHIISELVIHGLNAKIGDGIAGKLQGADLIKAMTKIYDGMKEGNWNTRIAGEGVGKTTQLVEALVIVTGESTEDVKAKLNEKSDEERKDLRANPQVKAAMEKIKVEKAKVRAKKSAADAKTNEEANPFTL